MNEQDTKASSELQYEKLVMIGTFVNFSFTFFLNYMQLVILNYIFLNFGIL